MELLLHQCRGAECYRCYYYNNNIESYAREMAKMNKPLRVINVKDMLAMAPEEWAKVCPPKPEDAYKDEAPADADDDPESRQRIDAILNAFHEELRHA